MLIKIYETMSSTDKKCIEMRRREEYIFGLVIYNKFHRLLTKLSRSMSHVLLSSFHL